MFHVPNEYRNTKHPVVGSDNSFGNNGYFVIPHHRIKNYVYIAIAADGMNWEHVSVSVTEIGKKQHRCPTWEEMCYVKSVFWDKEDCVIEYHPAESEYVNVHPYCLHLWRPTNQIIPIPPKEMVG